MFLYIHYEHLGELNINNKVACICYSDHYAVLLQFAHVQVLWWSITSKWYISQYVFALGKFDELSVKINWQEILSMFLYSNQLQEVSGIWEVIDLIIFYRNIFAIIYF